VHCNKVSPLVEGGTHLILLFPQAQTLNAILDLRKQPVTARVYSRVQ
jgi:hypothetical protein